MAGRWRASATNPLSLLLSSTLWWRLLPVARALGVRLVTQILPARGWSLRMCVPTITITTSGVVVVVVAAPPLGLHLRQRRRRLRLPMP